ncbi:hypothetical protein GCM10010289_43900 [Streptomyces violascens]|nr:hypothetical protein GCM10010289_43900 [Streptomyces violascens]
MAGAAASGTAPRRVAETPRELLPQGLKGQGGPPFETLRRLAMHRTRRHDLPDPDPPDTP